MVTRIADGREPVVTILFKNCHQYRAPFYDILRRVLDQKGIELRLIVGGGVAEDEAKGDVSDLEWSEKRAVRTIEFLGRTLLWQPALREAWRSDLIITEQASKQLFNIVLSFAQRPLRTKHGLWGHGQNFQRSIEGKAGERLKRLLTSRSRWFFAYNDLSARAAVEMGATPERLTSVMNSTDTRHIREVRRLLPAGTAADVRRELAMGSGPVVLFLGGLYDYKRPDFLIDAARHLRRLVPQVELLVIGDGSAADVVRAAAEEHEWIHHVGAQYDDDRVRYASVASLQMMPGLVGLNIVDGFALGLPTITTQLDWHSPEIDYLVDGVNGLIVDTDDPALYAEVVGDLLSDDDTLRALQLEAELCGHELSIEDMARRFADGVVQALGDDR